jgi:hypothetical protein
MNSRMREKILAQIELNKQSESIKIILDNIISRLNIIEKKLGNKTTEDYETLWFWSHETNDELSKFKDEYSKTDFNISDGHNSAGEEFKYITLGKTNIIIPKSDFQDWKKNVIKLLKST